MVYIAKANYKERKRESKEKKGKKIKRKSLKGQANRDFLYPLVKTGYFPTHSINIPHSPNTQKTNKKGKKQKNPC